MVAFSICGWFRRDKRESGFGPKADSGMSLSNVRRFTEGFVTADLVRDSTK